MKAPSKLDTAVGLIISIFILTAVLLINFSWFQILTDSLQQKSISTGILDYGTMGQILKRLGLVRFTENDFQRFKKTEKAGEQIEEITFQKKRQVGDFLYAANTAGEIGYKSTELLQAIQSKNGWPVISIAVSEKYLNDPDKGILANRDKKGREWETPVEISYMENGEVLFETYAGLRVHGGINRAEEWYRPSFRLYFRKKYGLAAVPQGLILPDLEIPLRTLVLKDTEWPPGYPLNNPLAYDIAGRVGSVVPATRLVEVYLNGKSHGMSYAVEHLSRRQWGQRFDHEDYLFFIYRANNSIKEQVTYIKKFGSVANEGENFSLQFVEESIDLANLSRQIISWSFCGTNDYCQGAGVYDSSDPDARGFWINWDMDQSFWDVKGASKNLPREIWQMPGLDRFFSDQKLKTGCYQKDLFFRLIKKSDEYKKYFLKLLVDTLNHCLTHKYLQSRIDYYQKMLIQYGKPHPEYIAMLNTFIEYRPGRILQEIKKKFSLRGPFDCEIIIPDGRSVIVDTYQYINSYTGKYFEKTPVHLNVPAKHSEHFKYWLINGGKKFEKNLSVQLLGDTHVKAVFSD